MKPIHDFSWEGTITDFEADNRQKNKGFVWHCWNNAILYCLLVLFTECSCIALCLHCISIITVTRRPAYTGGFFICLIHHLFLHCVTSVRGQDHNVKRTFTLAYKIVTLLWCKQFCIQSALKHYILALGVAFRNRGGAPSRAKPISTYCYFEMSKNNLTWIFCWVLH